MNTAPHPPSGPDIDVLADLAANLLPAAHDRSVRGHVDGCAECSSVLQALERTGSELRWLPPIAMPAEVFARIDSALAAEAKVVAISALRDRRKRRQQVFGVAAAGVILVGGVGVVLTQFLGSSPNADVNAGDDSVSQDPTPPDLDETSLPGAVSGLVTGGEGEGPLDLDGTAASVNCVASVQVAGVDNLIGVIEIRYGGRNRDAVFFTTSDPSIARVIVVDDCSLDNPDVVAIDEGRI